MGNKKHNRKNLSKIKNCEINLTDPDFYDYLGPTNYTINRKQESVPILVTVEPLHSPVVIVNTEEEKTWYNWVLSFIY